VVWEQLYDQTERLWEPAEICWFHATRILPTVDFSANGILPVSALADSIWAMLRSIDPAPPTEGEWLEFRALVEKGALGDCSRLYGIKMKQPGPFAFLIREELDHLDESGSVNYLRCPETVEDICICYEQTFGRPLLPAFLTSTRPCIVKFADPRPESVMGVVAFYLYRHARGLPAFRCNTCLDSRGAPISPDQILDVEWLPRTTGLKRG